MHPKAWASVIVVVGRSVSRPCSALTDLTACTFVRSSMLSSTPPTLRKPHRASSLRRPSECTPRFTRISHPSSDVSDSRNSRSAVPCAHHTVRPTGQPVAPSHFFPSPVAWSDRGLVGPRVVTWPWSSHLCSPTRCLQQLLFKKEKGARATRHFFPLASPEMVTVIVHQSLLLFFCFWDLGRLCRATSMMHHRISVGWRREIEGGWEASRAQRCLEPPPQRPAIRHPKAETPIVDSVRCHSRR